MTREISRRTVLMEWAAVVAGAIFLPRGAAAQAKVPITVYKDPNCGCCAKWVAHMAASGFSPTVTDTHDMKSIKDRYNVPPSLESCHTTLVGDYVIEGHVPAADIRKLLAQKPAGIVGLTIPGMPASAPGMDLLPFQPYTVLTFDGVGNTGVFARHDTA